RGRDAVILDDPGRGVRARREHDLRAANMDALEESLERQSRARGPALEPRLVREDPLERGHGWRAVPADEDAVAIEADDRVRAEPTDGVPRPDVEEEPAGEREGAVRRRSEEIDRVSPGHDRALQDRDPHESSAPPAH